MDITEHIPPISCRLAGQTIWFNQSLNELQPFRLEGLTSPPCSLPANLLELVREPPLLQAVGWLADKSTSISLWRDDNGYLLEIPAAGFFWTAMSGSCIYQVFRVPSANPSLLCESILGPPLALALCLSGIWCLHASAIEYENQLAVFVGSSGAGKSTLATYLADHSGIRQTADDILPVSEAVQGVNALPHFPQLKIHPEEQPGLAFPERLPLSVIYLLDEGVDVSLETLSPAEAAMSLAGHTVAAHLFDRQLISQHFTFCSQSATVVPVRKLIYPRKFSQLPQVWQVLKNDLAGIHA